MKDTTNKPYYVLNTRTGVRKYYSSRNRAYNAADKVDLTWGGYVCTVQPNPKFEGQR